MSRDNRQYAKGGSPETTIVVGAIIIVLILMLGFLFYAGKLHLPMSGSGSTNNGAGTNGNGTSGGSTNSGNGSNGTSGSSGTSGSNGSGTNNGSGVNIQISLDPNKPGASVKTTDPNTNTNVNLPN